MRVNWIISTVLATVLAILVWVWVDWIWSEVVEFDLAI